ncbi:Pentatricopeptide repeat-containing protein At2g36980, mitochondrial [Linum perenne]
MSQQRRLRPPETRPRKKVRPPEIDSKERLMGWPATILQTVGGVVWVTATVEAEAREETTAVRSRKQRNPNFSPPSSPLLPFSSYHLQDHFTRSFWLPLPSTQVVRLNVQQRHYRLELNAYLLLPAGSSLFHHKMRLIGSKPDDFTFTAILNVCSSLGSFRDGTKLHALVVVLGCQSLLPVNNSLADMYGKCFDLVSSGNVFKEMNFANEVTFCSLLFTYTSSSLFHEASIDT